MTNLVTAAAHRLARLVGHAEPSVPPRVATFIGVATLTTSRTDFRGPLARPVSADLLIDGHGGVTVTSVYVEPVRLSSVTCAITLTLTTDSLGSRAEADGRITVAGNATFHRGYLGGRLATMVVTGAISPAAEMRSRRSVA